MTRFLCPSGVARRGQEIRAVPEDGAAQRPEEEGEGPPQSLRQRPVRSGPDRQAPGPGPGHADRQRRRAQPRLLLVRPHAVGPEEHALHPQHLHVRVPGPAQAERTHASAAAQPEQKPSHHQSDGVRPGLLVGVSTDTTCLSRVSVLRVFDQHCFFIFLFVRSVYGWMSRTCSRWSGCSSFCWTSR